MNTSYIVEKLIGTIKAKKLEKALNRNGYTDIAKLKTLLFESPGIISGIIGDSAVETLKAAFNLTTNMLLDGLKFDYYSEGLNNPEKVVDLLRNQIGTEEKEHFCIIFLNSSNKFLGYEKLSTGTINQAMVYPREIIKKTLEYNASAVILAHNHPSGNSNPSSEDINLTKDMELLLSKIEVRLHDHIIITVSDAYSIKGQRSI